MALNREIQKFREEHPWPDESGIKTLYRFSRVNKEKLNYLEDLFLHRKLYHPTPNQLNDPFECKPHFRMPQDKAEIARIWAYLVKVVRDNGVPQKEAERLVEMRMREPGQAQWMIQESALHVFSQARICSFTTSNRHLLFWSHYADSHKGFCVGFDARKQPICGAFKVRYSDEYPKATYPAPQDERMLEPALVKSSYWEHEEEYRTIFTPAAEEQPSNDGTSLILDKDVVKSVFLGANMAEDEKDLLVRTIERGPFEPQIFDTELSSKSFELKFKPR